MALSVIPTLYVACKFFMPITFNTTDTNGDEIPYTVVGTPPQCFFATTNAHNATTADAALTCTVAYSGASGIWEVSIPAANLTYALLNGLFTMPSAPPYLIMIVPASSRDFATGAWYEKREALAA